MLRKSERASESKNTKRQPATHNNSFHIHSNNHYNNKLIARTNCGCTAVTQAAVEEAKKAFQMYSSCSHVNECYFYFGDVSLDLLCYFFFFLLVACDALWKSCKLICLSVSVLRTTGKVFFFFAFLSSSPSTSASCRLVFINGDREYAKSHA